jgi:hypothetical protein
MLLQRLYWNRLVLPALWCFSNKYINIVLVSAAI